MDFLETSKYPGILERSRKNRGKLHKVGEGSAWEICVVGAYLIVTAQAT